jgi:hypothetical protein
MTLAEWCPPEAWWHVTAPLTCGSNLRGAALLNRIIDQFEVEANPRYRAGKTTYCNVWTNDLTRALGCEVAQTEQSSRGLIELDANAMVAWLAGPRGRAHGWTECKQSTARMACDVGYPVVATWLNIGGIGHIAPGAPAPDGAVDDGRLWLANVGANNFRLGPLAKAFGVRPCRFFTHT